MKLDDIFLFGKTQSDLQLQVTDFLDLCDDLEVLTQEENTNLLANNGFKNHRLAYKKVVMLEKFDALTSKVFKRVRTEAPNNIALQTHLIEIVQDLQEKLKINTGLHLHVIGSNQQFRANDRTTCH